MRALTSTAQGALHPAVAANGVSVRIVALLAVGSFINYVDRGNLATAGPLIRDQFSLSNAGLLLSAFFWSYAPGQLPAGSGPGLTAGQSLARPGFGAESFNTRGVDRSGTHNHPR